MLEKIKPVSNPLTIIALFAGLAEIGGTIVLPLLEKEIQATYVWFLMLFPFGLVLLFFATLNKNNRVLYAPSDFEDDQSFMQLIEQKIETVETSVKAEFDNKLDRVLQAQSLVRRGMELMEKSKFVQSSDLFKEALTFNPNDADAKVGLANALNFIDSKNHSYPIQLITEALEQNQHNAWALYNRACIMSLNSKTYGIKAIIKDLKSAISLNSLYSELAVQDEDFAEIKEQDAFKSLFE